MSPKITFSESLSWQLTYPIPAPDGNTEIRIASLDKNTVFASNRRRDGTFDILRSADGGQTWNSVKNNIPAGADANWISIQHSNKDVIALSVWGAGIYLSENGGDTWTKIFGQLFPRAVAINPTSSGTIFAGISDSNAGMYHTTDKGINWSKEPLGNGNSVALVIDSNNRSRVFGSVGSDLFRSDDSGTTWSLALPLHGGFTSLAIDVSETNTIYATLDSGLFKSTDNGVTWFLKTNGIGNAFFFRVAQDDNGYLYTSIRGLPGGIWRSKDRGETWENISDPSWANTLTWGMDARGGRVYVGVEGLGIFIANTDGSPINPPPPPPPPPGPNPVVIIPGFGGSWSDKAIIFHQPTDYHNWTIMPFKAPDIYNPFLDVLANDGLQRDQNSFFFAYDFTRPVMDTAGWLNNFLTNEVLPKNPGKKVDIVAHSMGGLLARTCFELVDGCRDKINKIVSAGTPHQGAVDDYAFWEGADLSSLDLLSRFGAKLLLHFDGFPKWNEVKIIQEKVLGAKDFLPIFDYIFEKPLWSLSPLAQNRFLSNLPMNSVSQTLALSGNKPNSTTSYLTVSPPNKKELVNGYWIDGKPKILTKDLGDGTVLNSSSSLFGAQNKSYNINHDGYLNTLTPVNDILQFLGLSPVSFLSTTNKITSATIYYSSSPDMTINVEPATGETISQSSPSVVFVLNGKPQKRSFTISSKKGGDYKIEAWYSDDQGKDINAKPVNIKLLKGEKRKIEVSFD